MVTLIDELVAGMKANQNPTAEERRDFVHKLSRCTVVKEKHADTCDHEIITLWGDYFKPEHFQKYPQLNELTFKVMKLTGKARQEVNMQAAEELLETVNKIAEIFWETKGMGTTRFPAPYPTAKETVYPTSKK